MHAGYPPNANWFKMFVALFVHCCNFCSCPMLPETLKSRRDAAAVRPTLQIRPFAEFAVKRSHQFHQFHLEGQMGNAQPLRPDLSALEHAHGAQNAPLGQSQQHQHHQHLPISVVAMESWNFLVAAFEIWINFMSSYCTLIFSVLEGLEN